MHRREKSIRHGAAAERRAGPHHGTLLFDSDAEMLSGALRADPEKFRSKAAQSVRSRVCNIRDCLPGDMELREFWTAILAELGRDGLVRESLDEAELAEVRRIAEEKYGSWDWNWGRSPDFGFRARRRFPAGSLELRLDPARGQDKGCGDIWGLPCAAGLRSGAGRHCLAGGSSAGSWRRRSADCR